MVWRTAIKIAKKSAKHFPLIRNIYWKAQTYAAASNPDWWDPNWAVANAARSTAGVEMIIFSKNRACQLDQLIRSLEEYLEELELYHITVIYVAENSEFKEGYSIVQRGFPFLDFVAQRSDQTIGQQIQTILDVSEKEFFCMLVDDDVLIRRLSLRSPQFETFRRDLSICSLSIRLCHLINYCQPLDVPEKPPRITNGGVFHWYATPFWRLVRDLSWRLGELDLGAGDWAVSMSMDGNFFRLTEFREYFRHLPDIKRFGDIEITMCRMPIPKEYGICFNEAKLINIPFNSVRADYRYPNMEVTPEYLNELFLRGRRLDFDHLRSLSTFTCHLEVAPKWIEGRSIP